MALLLSLLLLKLKKRADNGVRLPPGPWQLPVIGSLRHLLGKPLVHRALADLARRLDAPLMYLRLGEVPIVVATSPGAAHEIMRTHDATFATRPWSTTMRIMMADEYGLGFAPYGEQWRQLRKISVLELLSARRVQSFRHVREEEAARLVAAVAATPPGEPADVSERIAVAIADSTVRALIGDRFGRREEFLETIEEESKLTSGFNLSDLFPSSSWLVNLVSGTARRSHAMHRKSIELMEHAIKQHDELRAAMAAKGRVVEEDDLVGVLLRIQKEGGLNVPLTTGTIKAAIFDLFGAGSKTSAITLQWAMSELIRNPNAMKKAQAEVRSILNGKPKVTEDDLGEMKYLKLIIKETLRLHPPAPLLIPRESMESCKILGYDVPKGTTVLVNAWAIGRDPRFWEDADEFKPERFESIAVDYRGTDFEYIPFGAGRRICPGIQFAQANMELVLAALLYHFDWKVASGSKPGELDMAEEMGLTIRRKNNLLLYPIVRVPLQAMP
ncbi:premnaspirodiene oxygenase-like [Panicum miliaceum]|uniref:Premnaspirodiene oxygenase-like n=1 Tax=Panicum miliaceum TaxID=4540 RepID=A0A3L6SN86_PANMI|nr:premnaspirodiene oxygenase-like [Panicum miliaceum]